MRVKIDDARDEFADLYTYRDYLDVIREKISWEFLHAFEENWYVCELKDEDGFSIAEENEWLQRQMEDYERTMDDVNSEIQHYLVALEGGERINRQKIIKAMKQWVKMINEMR